MGAKINREIINTNKPDELSTRISKKCCGNCQYFLDTGSFGTHDYSCMNADRDCHTVLFPEKSGCSKYVKGDLTTKDLEEAQRNIRL